MLDATIEDWNDWLKEKVVDTGQNDGADEAE